MLELAQTQAALISLDQLKADLALGGWSGFTLTLEYDFSRVWAHPRRPRWPATSFRWSNRWRRLLKSPVYREHVLRMVVPAWDPLVNSIGSRCGCPIDVRCLSFKLYFVQYDTGIPASALRAFWIIRRIWTQAAADPEACEVFEHPLYEAMRYCRELMEVQMDETLAYSRRRRRLRSVRAN